MLLPNFTGKTEQVELTVKYSRDHIMRNQTVLDLLR